MKKCNYNIIVYLRHEKFNYGKRKEANKIRRYKGLVYDNYLLSILNYLRFKYFFESESIKERALWRISKFDRKKKNDTFVLMKVKFSDFFFRESKKQVIKNDLLAMDKKKERRLLFRTERRQNLFFMGKRKKPYFKNRRFFFFFDPKKNKSFSNGLFEQKFFSKLRFSNLINNYNNSENVSIGIDKLIAQKGLLLDDFATVSSETSRFPFSSFKSVDVLPLLLIFVFCVLEILLVSFCISLYFGSLIDLLTFFFKNFLIISPYYLVSNQSNILALMCLFYFVFWMVSESLEMLTEYDYIDDFDDSYSVEIDDDFLIQVKTKRPPMGSSILYGIYTLFYVVPAFFLFYFFFFKFFSFFFILFKVLLFPTIAFPFLILLKFYNLFRDLFFFKYNNKSSFEKAYRKSGTLKKDRKDKFSKFFRRFLNRSNVLPSLSTLRSYNIPYIQDRNSLIQNIKDKHILRIKNRKIKRKKKRFKKRHKTFFGFKRKFWKKSSFFLNKDFSFSNTDFLLRKMPHFLYFKQNKGNFSMEDNDLKKFKLFLKRSNIFFWKLYNNNKHVYDLKYSSNEVKRKQLFPRFKYFRIKNPLLNKVQIYRKFFRLLHYHNDSHFVVKNKVSSLFRKKSFELLRKMQPLSKDLKRDKRNFGKRKRRAFLKKRKIHFFQRKIFDEEGGRGFVRFYFRRRRKEFVLSKLKKNGLYKDYFINYLGFRSKRNAGLAFKSKKVFNRRLAANYFFLLKRFGSVKKLNLKERRPLYAKYRIHKPKFVVRKRRYKTMRPFIYGRIRKFKIRRGGKKRKKKFRKGKENKSKIFRKNKFFLWMPRWLKKNPKGIAGRLKKRLRIFDWNNAEESNVNWGVPLRQISLPFFRTYRNAKFDFNKYKKYSFFLRKLKKKARRKRTRLKFVRSKYDKNFIKKSFFFSKNEEILRRVLDFNAFVRDKHPLKSYNFFRPDQNLGKLSSFFFLKSFKKNRNYNRNRSDTKNFFFKKAPLFVNDFSGLSRFQRRIILFDQDNIDNSIISKKPVITKDHNFIIRHLNLLKINLKILNIFRSLKLFNLRLKMLLFDTLTGEQRSFHIITNKYLNFLQHRLQKSLSRRYKEFYEANFFNRRRIFRYNKNKYSIRRRRSRSRRRRYKRNLQGFLLKLRLSNPGMVRGTYHKRVFRDKLFSLFFEKNDMIPYSNFLKNEGSFSYSKVYKMLSRVKIRPFYDLFEGKKDYNFIDNNFWNKYRHLLLMESVLLKDLFSKNKSKLLNYNFYNKKTKYNILSKGQFLDDLNSHDINHMEHLKKNIINTRTYRRSKKFESRNRKIFSSLKKRSRRGFIKVKLYKNLLLYRKFRKMSLQLELLKVYLSKIDENTPDFLKWKSQFIKLLFLRKLCLLFLLRKKQDSVFFFNYFRLNDKRRINKKFSNTPFITFKKRLKKKTKLFFKDFLLWKKWKNFLSLKVKNKLLSRQKKLISFLDNNMVGGNAIKRPKNVLKSRSPYKYSYYLFRSKRHLRNSSSVSIFKKKSRKIKQPSKVKGFFFSKFRKKHVFNKYSNFFLEKVIKNSKKFLTQDYLKHSPVGIHERDQFLRDYILYINGIDEDYVGKGFYDLQDSFWLDPIKHERVNFNNHTILRRNERFNRIYHAMSRYGFFPYRSKKKREFFLNSFFSRLRGAEEEDQIFNTTKKRTEDYFPKFPVSSFVFSKRFLASKGIDNVFFKKKKLKNFRALKLDEGLNINLNFFLNVKKKTELNSKKSFFLRLGNFIKRGVNLFFLKKLNRQYITHRRKFNYFKELNHSSSYEIQEYLFSLLLRKYLVFLDLNNKFVYSNKINNFGKVKTFILYLKLRKMVKSLDPENVSYKNDNFDYLQKFRLPFSRFIFWVLRNELKKKYLFQKIKKNRKIFFNNKYFNVYYPSILVDHIHGRKRKFFFNKVLKRNKSKIFSTLMSKSFKILFLPKSYKKKVYKKHRVLFGQKNLRKRMNDKLFHKTTNILLGIYNILESGSYAKKSPLSRSLFFSNNVLKDTYNLTFDSNLKYERRRKKFFDKNKNKDFYFLSRTGLVRKNFMSNYLNFISKNYINLDRQNLNFIFNGNSVFNSRKSSKSIEYFYGNFFKKSFLSKFNKANNMVFFQFIRLFSDVFSLSNGVLDYYGFFPMKKNDFNKLKLLFRNRYFLPEIEAGNVPSLKITDISNLLDQKTLFKFKILEDNNRQTSDNNKLNFLPQKNNVLNISETDLIGLRRRWLFMRHFLHKYIDVDFNVKKKDKLMFDYDFFLFRKYRKYNYILNNIFFTDNIINKKRLTNSNNDFYFDWWNMNLSFLSKYRDLQLFFIKKNLLNNKNLGIKINNNNLGLKNLSSSFFNVNNVLLNSNKIQHNVELFPRYVSKSLREKLNETYTQKEKIYSMTKLIKDPFMLYKREIPFDNFKRVKKRNTKKSYFFSGEEKKDYFLFNEFLKKKFPILKILDFRYQALTGEKKIEQRSGIAPNIYAGAFPNKIFAHRHKFKPSFKFNRYHRFSDPRNFAFYPFFVNRKFYKKYSSLLNNKKVAPNLFFNFLIKVGLLNKYKFFENRELFSKLNLKSDLVLPMKANYNYKNFKTTVVYWKQLKSLFKFNTKKNFLIWLKRKYGSNLLHNFKNNNFIWNDKYKFNDGKLKSLLQIGKLRKKLVVKNKQKNKFKNSDLLRLKTEAVYSNGNIRISLNRSKEDFFFKRQSILKSIKNSVFSFKALLGFLYFKYQMFSWNDRLNFHVKLDDFENFIDFELEKIIIERTNELFLPSYWVYRIPLSNIFYNYFLDNDNFLDSSLTLTNESEVVMRLNTFLNVFNANFSNYYKFFYDDSGIFTKIIGETLFLPKAMGLNAFFNMETQLREKLNKDFVCSEISNLVKINDIILAEQLKKLTYDELYKLILQYENLILDRKQRRFLNLNQVVENDFLSNFNKLFDIFLWEKNKNILKPFFYLEDKNFLIDKTQREVLSNFSFIEHLFNSSVIGNISYPQKVWILDKFLKWLNGHLDLFMIDAKIFKMFGNYLNFNKGIYYDSFFNFLLKTSDKIYKSNFNLYFENLISYNWIYSNNFIPFFFYLFNVYFFLFLYFIIVFLFFFWHINFIYKNASAEASMYVDGSDWDSRPVVNQKTTDLFFTRPEVWTKRTFKNTYANFLDMFSFNIEKKDPILENERMSYNPMEKYPVKGLSFFGSFINRRLKVGTSLFRRRLGRTRIMRKRKSSPYQINAHFERTCMPRKFFSVLRFCTKRTWHHHIRILRQIKYFRRIVHFKKINKRNNLVLLKEPYNRKLNKNHNKFSLKFFKNLSLIKNEFKVKKKRSRFFIRSKATPRFGAFKFFSLKYDNIYNYDTRILTFFRRLVIGKHNFGFRKKFFIFSIGIPQHIKKKKDNDDKFKVKFQQVEYNKILCKKIVRLFKTKKFFLRRRDFWLKIKVDLKKMSFEEKILSDRQKKDNLGKEFREREAQREAQKKKEEAEEKRRSNLSKEEREAEDKKKEEERIEEERKEETEKKLQEEMEKKAEESRRLSEQTMTNTERKISSKFVKSKKKPFENFFVYKRTFKRPKSLVFFRNRLFENFAEDQLYLGEPPGNFFMPVANFYMFRYFDIWCKATFFFFKFLIVFFIFFVFFLLFYKFYLFIFYWFIEIFFN